MTFASLFPTLSRPSLIGRKATIGDTTGLITSVSLLGLRVTVTAERTDRGFGTKRRQAKGPVFVSAWRWRVKLQD